MYIRAPLRMGAELNLIEFCGTEKNSEKLNSIVNARVGWEQDQNMGVRGGSEAKNDKKSNPEQGSNGHLIKHQFINCLKQRASILPVSLFDILLQEDGFYELYC